MSWPAVAASLSCTATVSGGGLWPANGVPATGVPAAHATPAASSQVGAPKRHRVAENRDWSRTSVLEVQKERAFYGSAATRTTADSQAPLPLYQGGSWEIGSGVAR